MSKEALSKSALAKNKIPRAFDTLNRHIWYDQMKKNKERRVYTVVEHKVTIDPFFKRDDIEPVQVSEECQSAPLKRRKKKDVPEEKEEVLERTTRLHVTLFI